MTIADVLELAGRQAGVLATRQAVALGVPATTLRSRAVREGWVHLHRGVWLTAGHTRTPRARAVGALLSAGDAAALTGASALAAHRVRDRHPATPSVVVPTGRGRPRRRRGIELTTTQRPLASRTVDGLRVVGVPEALLHLAAVGTSDRTLRDDVVVAVQRRALAGAGRLRLPDGARGAPTLRRVHAEATLRGPDSPLALRVATALVRSGVEVDARPAVVPARGRSLHPDVTVRGRCLAIECDGLTHHHTQAQLHTDHAKDRGYAVAGWLVARVGWRELRQDWPAVLADVESLAARARPRPRPRP